MEDTPAAMDRETGQMYINPKRYFALTPFQREFVKLHEKGHYILNTDSEMAADEYAFNHLAGTQFRSLKQCIECLEEILDENLIGHKVRVDHMYQLAMRWDKQHPILKATNFELQQKEDPIYIDNIGTIDRPINITNEPTVIPTPTPTPTPCVEITDKPSEGLNKYEPEDYTAKAQTNRENSKTKYIIIGVIVLIVLIALNKR